MSNLPNFTAQPLKGKRKLKRKIDENLIQEVLVDKEAEKVSQIQIKSSLVKDEVVITYEPTVTWGSYDLDFVTDIMVKFSQKLSGMDLHPYQIELEQRIFRSLLLNDGEEITALFARQSGKSETVAHICVTLMVFLPILAEYYPNELGHFKKGIRIGLFAPTLEQAYTTHSRMDMRLSSENADFLLSDSDINATKKYSGGMLDVFGPMVQLPSGRIIPAYHSYCKIQSTAKQTKIESKTYDFIVVEEAQDADSMKVQKSIHPMTASVNGTLLKVGTSTTFVSDFYHAIQRNKRKELHTRIRNHFEYDYKTVQRYNPKYKAFIQRERERLGEASDGFRMSYCVAPETRILTSDLRWVRADSIRKGDSLVGFDESNPELNHQRRYKETIVEDVGKIKRPCYSLLFEDGTKVTCSSEHKWLVTTAGRRNVWKETKDIKETDRVYKMCDTWEDPSSNYRLGYLAAAFDGEGCFTQLEGKINQISFTQKKNEMMDKVQEYLTELGFTFGITPKDQDKDVLTLFLTGGKYDLLRFMGSVRPFRLLPKLSVEKLGTLKMKRYKERNFIHPRLIKKEFIGMQTVIPIRTTTRTYIAEGLASHNCLEWLIEKGMAITPQMFEEYLKDSSGRFEYESDGQSIYVGGLDLAKEGASTVFTVAKLFSEQDIEEEGEIVTKYTKKIVNWLEMKGDNWETQFSTIVDFIRSYKVKLLAVDSTGLGDPIFDRLEAVLEDFDCTLIPVIYNLKIKHEMATLFYTELRAHRIQIPFHQSVRKSSRFKNFLEEFYSCLKIYKGSYMQLRKPDDKNARDDFVNSLLLLLYGVEQGYMTQAICSKNFFFGHGTHGRVTERSKRFDQAMLQMRRRQAASWRKNAR